MLSVRGPMIQSIKAGPPKEPIPCKASSKGRPSPMVRQLAYLVGHAASGLVSVPATLTSTTSVLTAATFVYTAGAGITAAGTRLALRLILTE